MAFLLLFTIIGMLYGTYSLAMHFGASAPQRLPELPDPSTIQSTPTVVAGLFGSHPPTMPEVVVSDGEVDLLVSGDVAFESGWPDMLPPFSVYDVSHMPKPLPPQVKAFVSSYWPDLHPDWCARYDLAARRCLGDGVMGVRSWRQMELQAGACPSEYYGQTVSFDGLEVLCIDVSHRLYCDEVGCRFLVLDSTLRFGGTFSIEAR